MKLLTRLTQLDQRVVPRLGRGLTRISRAVGGWQVRPLSVIAGVLVVAVVGTAVWRLVRPEPGGAGGTSPAWVGVRDGESVPAYIDASGAELAALNAQSPLQPVYALVSFDHYLTPDQVRTVATIASDLRTVRGYARVPLPQRQTERVTLAAERLPQDMVADMAAVAARKNVDATTYYGYADREPDEQMRMIWRSNAELSKAEAAAYQGGCACVFALLVRATPATLTNLARRPDVRVVDPAPTVAGPDDAVFVAPLPEQVDRIVPPADDYLPSPAGTR